MVCPAYALSDHAPDNLTQELNPNYVGCMMAVDDADIEFRDELQSTCFGRMGDICSGRNGITRPSQVIDCLYFENLRGIEFLITAVPHLPLGIEKKGFFGHGYQRRRDGILEDIKILKNQDKSQKIEVAIQQSLAMASSVTILFWLARETGTPLEAYQQPIFGDH